MGLIFFLTADSEGMERHVVPTHGQGGDGGEILFPVLISFMLLFSACLLRTLRTTSRRMSTEHIPSEHGELRLLREISSTLGTLGTVVGGRRGVKKGPAGGVRIFSSRGGALFAPGGEKGTGKLL